MAQIGCFVPAKLFELSIVDKIFIRMGGVDKISEKKSTFFVEMEETYVLYLYIYYLFINNSYLFN